MGEVEIGDDVDLGALAAMCEDYSGADIAIVCRDASMMSMRRVTEAARKKGLGFEAMQRELLENKDQLNTAVTQTDFLLAIKKVNKSVGQDDLKKYDDWVAEFGSA